MRNDDEMRYAIDTYADMVKRICFIHLKQECDVDDVFQDVFLKYANADEFRDREHEKAWLIRVSINACKDSLTTWFKKRVGLYGEISIVSDRLQCIDIKQDSLLPEVLKLPQNYRNVLYLYYYEGYKAKEIAQLLQCKENTVHTWLKRAKEELKVQLGGYEE